MSDLNVEPCGIFIYLRHNTIITFRKLYQLNLLSGIPNGISFVMIPKPQSEPQSDFWLWTGKEGERKGKGVDGIGQAWASEADWDCSPASHTWTLALIESSMKYRWSLRWRDPPTHTHFPSPLHCFSCPLSPCLSDSRSRLHAGAVLACACPTAH